MPFLMPAEKPTFAPSKKEPQAISCKLQEA
jgi:hypothetical protein